ncbi:MAG: 4-(cytidine 5'-diphospho)-2-C-methyl-D-erythritol kinase [Gammaproteobacteria bacterium]
MSDSTWPAPAKLNLFLHILGRRADGYHRLQTVFQFLEYADELDFEVVDDGRISIAGNLHDIPPEQNLIVRAAAMLKDYAGTKQGAIITFSKRIPVGGGLGGGSSDAATTLVALNKLWNIHLPMPTLAELGLALGADVPVFIHGSAAWAEGIGERLTPVSLPEGWFLIIHPGCSVPTARIFNIPDLTRNSSPITIRDFLGGAGHNDCESVVFREFPEIARAAEWLGERTRARLTGTGACVFGRFDSKNAAQAALTGLPREWQGFVSKGKNTSPLRERLGKAGDL